MFGELSHFFGIVGHQFNALNTDVSQHLSSDSVVSRIGRMAKHEVRIQGVSSGILQVVSLDFGVQADAAPLLSQVEQGPPTPLNDGVQSSVKLWATVASSAAKHIAGQAFRVDADKNRVGSFHVTQR